MLERLRKHASTVAVAALTAMVTATAPAIAEVIADFAKNADKVDGKHAVGFNATSGERKGKLVATSRGTGRLPNDIIAKAPNANLLDGIDSATFVLEGETVQEATHAATADEATHAVTADEATHATSADSATNASNASNADFVDGVDSTSLMRRAIYRKTVASTGTCPNPDACFLRVDCDSGDTLLSGGYDSIDNGTRVFADRPGKDLSNNQPTAFGWVVWWDNNSTADTVEVTIICANN
jgi:hypothetical protein